MYINLMCVFIVHLFIQSRETKVEYPKYPNLLQIWNTVSVLTNKRPAKENKHLCNFTLDSNPHKYPDKLIPGF